MAKPTRHVVFSPSTRGSLLQALKTAGRPEDNVVALFDDLRCGPLEPFDPEARERWLNDEADYGLEPGFVRLWHDEFSSQALDPGHRLVVWTTRRAPQDWVGYLAWLTRLGDAPADVIDISDIVFEGTDWQGVPWRRRQPVPLITPAHFIHYGLFDLARAITPDDRKDALAEWRRLGEENGAFRAVRDGRLTSLPLTAFDDQLVAAASTTFRKAAFVIGTVLGEMHSREDWPVGDLALSARLRTLVEDGRLEAQGDPYGSIRFFEVRLRTSGD
ncbi:DUF3658 domain-containing protein [Methylopila sp. M107]|uniref:DUF3658 domain-containing protein n=1 Tax=Methylopila sp. M107 TaxID=1101190 RepID=UPI00036ABD54|nr:DUF3658 domain-containing protein [Methylopila sp. M107]